MVRVGPKRTGPERALSVTEPKVAPDAAEHLHSGWLMCANLFAFIIEKSGWKEFVKFLLANS